VAQQRCLSSGFLDLPETHAMLKQTCRDFVDNEVKSKAAEIDKTKIYPDGLVRQITLGPNYFTLSI